MDANETATWAGVATLAIRLLVGLAERLLDAWREHSMRRERLSTESESCSSSSESPDAEVTSSHRVTRGKRRGRLPASSAAPPIAAAPQEATTDELEGETQDEPRTGNGSRTDRRTTCGECGRANDEPSE
jgi:hypothetical protein